MRLENITAAAHPSGNRIDLTWVNPDPDGYPRVRVVRRQGTYPISHEDGVVVPQFSLEPSFQGELDDGEERPSSALQKQFADHQAPLAGNGTIIVDVPGGEWRVVDGEQEYVIRKTDDRLSVYNERLTFAADEHLKGETVYYYTLFPHQDGTPPAYEFDDHNRTAAMATAPYNMAARMYDLLPRIYHRYDEDRQKGQLRRFLDLAGGQLDQLYSNARAALDLHHVPEVDGRLLPLLAGWIGWQTNYRLGFDAQRNEIRHAPHIYRTIGIIPTVEATVKRVLGWECRTKEFVHNIFLSNRPERLNLWERQRQGSGEWSEPAAPLSLDFAYEGRPAAAYEGDDTLWLFYHTRSKVHRDARKGSGTWRDQWDVWYKTSSVFDVAPAFQRDLDEGIISTSLQQAFKDQGFALAEDAAIEKKDSLWRITDVENGATYTVRAGSDQLRVHRWAASQPLTDRTCLDRHPTAVVRDDKLCVFWDVYGGGHHTWRIDYRVRPAGEGWSAIETLADPEADAQPERRRPWAVGDGGDGLWLFWLEKVETQWRLKYNRQEGPDWDDEAIQVFLGSAQDFPLDDNGKSVQNDVFVCTDPGSRLWVFWARRVKAPRDASEAESEAEKETTRAANQTVWQIAYRHQEADGWSDVGTLPPDPADYDCREPAAVWNETEGAIELFYSSNQDGSWSIWQSTLTAWETAESVTGNPYSQRDSLPVALPSGSGALLIYRSNESLIYLSKVYGATETLDARYAGCTTVDTRNPTKIALRGQYEDFQTYTYDSGQNGEPTDRDWYARDTVGIYLAPDIEDPTLIVRNQNLIENVLTQFLPIQVRTVFVIEPHGYKELVYTYDFPAVEPQRLIGEQVYDSAIPETYFGLRDSHPKDVVPGWVRMRAWGDEHPEPEHFRPTVDFTEEPVDTRFRTWHLGLEMEDDPWT